MVSSERSSSYVSVNPISNKKKTHFFIVEKKISVKNLRFFFELLAKFSDFVNSDDCIGKITSKSIGL